MKNAACLLIIAAIVSDVSLRAEVKPNALFSDGAVLQRNMPVPVWGSAKDGETVTIKFQNQSVSTVAKDGKWLVRLEPVQVGPATTMTIAGENTVTITNVVAGEVWVCGGQSNMEFHLERASNGDDAIPAALDPQLRLFTVRPSTNDAPQSEAPVITWSECTSAVATKFSAVGYFFGRDLRKALNVPVGLISSSLGSTPVEAWTDRKSLENIPELKPLLDQHAKASAENDRGPSSLYNAMIAPLQPYAIRGAIWYQGESNVRDPNLYQTTFPAMITGWRSTWNQGNFPFLFVQIAPNKGMTPELREAQLLTWKKTPNTAMAVITDEGNANDIHPSQKEPVGSRLALAARALAYGEQIEFSGPVYESNQIQDGKVVLSFQHVGHGLIAKSGKLKGFTIAGTDSKFVPAEAEIAGESVVVSSPDVPAPVSVRYGWANVPAINLFNKNDLPATPFRTDPATK